MTATWLDGPDYAASAARDAEDALCAPVLCPECQGAGELKSNPAWPDPQGEISHGDCPRCLGDGTLDAQAARLNWLEHEVDLALERRGEGSW